MAWYSFFLMNIPETFIIIALPFVLFGLSIQKHFKQMLVFAFTQGAVIFLASVFLQNSFKPFITLLSFYFLVVFIFRFSFLKSLIITLTTFVFLVVIETITTLAIIYFIDISYIELFNNPLLRILTSFVMVQLPMLLIILVLNKCKLTIKLPSYIR